MNQNTQRFKTDSFRKPEILGRTVRTQRRPKLQINWRLVKTFFYLGLLLIILYFIFFGNTFKIKKIDMEGIKSVEVSDYLQKSLIGRNILLFLPGSYLSDLSRKYPILEQAQIIRGLPSTIKIIARERKQVLTWCLNSCFDIDNYGYAYQLSPPTQDKVVLTDQSGLVIKIGDQVTSPEFISFYLNALSQTENLGLKITGTRIEETSFKLIFRTSENYDIVFDTSGSLSNQISALKQVLEKNRADIKEYVDLRVEGLVYVK